MLQNTEYQTQTLQDKAIALRTYLNNPDWLQIIGTGLENGIPCIFVYVNKLTLARKLVPNTWYDIPVKIRKINKININ